MWNALSSFTTLVSGEEEGRQGHEAKGQAEDGLVLVSSRPDSTSPSLVPNPENSPKRQVDSGFVPISTRDPANLEQQRKQILQLESQLIQAEEQNQQIVTEYAKLLRDKEQEFIELSETQVQTSVALEEKENELNQTRAKYDELMHNAEQTIRSQEEKLKQVLEQNSKLIAVAKKLKAARDKESNSSSDESSKLTAKLNDQAEQILQMQSTIEKQSAELKESQQLLQMEKDRVETEVIERERESKRRCDEESQSQQLQHDISTLQRQLAAAEGAIKEREAELVASVSELEAKLASSLVEKQRLSESLETARKESDQQVKLKCDELGRVQEKLQRLQHEHHTLTELHATQITAQQELQAKCLALESAGDSSTSLEAEVQAAKDQAAAATQAYEEATDEVSSLRVCLEEVHADLSDATELSQSLKETCNARGEELEACRQQVCSLQSQLATGREEQQAMLSEIEVLTERTQQLESENALLQKAQADHIQRGNSLEEALSHAKAELQESQNAQATLTVHLETLQTSFTSQSTAFEQASRSLEEAKQRAGRLEDQLNDQTAMLDVTKLEARDSDRLSEQCTTLQNQVLELQDREAELHQDASGLNSQILEQKERADSAEAALHDSQLLCEKRQMRISELEAQLESISSESAARIEALQSAAAAQDDVIASFKIRSADALKHESSLEDQVTSLQQKVEEDATTISELESRLADESMKAQVAEDKEKSLCKNLQRARAELEEERAALTALRGEHSNVQSLEETTSQLQEQHRLEVDRLLEEQRLRQDTMKHEVEVMSRKNDDLKATTMKLQEIAKQHEACSGLTEELRRELELVRSEHSALEAVVKQQQQSKQHLEDELSQLLKKLSCMEDGNLETAAEVPQLKRSLEECTAELQQARDELTSAQSEKEDLAKEMVQCVDSVRHAQEELQQATSRADRVETELIDTSQRYQELVAAFSEAQKSISDTTTRLKQVDAERASAEEKCASLHLQLESMSETQLSLSQQLETSSTEGQKLKNELEKESRLRAQLEEEVRTLDESRTSLQCLLDQERLQRSTLQTASEELRDQESLVSRLQHELNQVQADKDEVSSCLQAKEQSMERMSDENEALRRSLLSAHQDRDDVRSQLQCLLDSQQHQIAEATEARKQFEAEMHQLRFQCEELSKEVGLEQSKRQDLEAKNQSLTEEVESLSERLETKHTELLAMKDETNRQATEIQKLRDQSQAQSAEIERLESILAQSQEARPVDDSVATEHAASLESKDSQVNALQKQVEKAKLRMKDMAAQFTKLKDTSKKILVRAKATEDKLATALSEKAQLQKRLQTVQSTAHRSDTQSDLEAECSTLREQYADLQRKTVSFREMRDNMKQKMSTLVQKLRALTLEREKHLQEIDELRKNRSSSHRPAESADPLDAFLVPEQKPLMPNPRLVAPHSRRQQPAQPPQSNPPVQARMSRDQSSREQPATEDDSISGQLHSILSSVKQQPQKMTELVGSMLSPEK